MKAVRYIQVAIETIFSHKLRAFLTMLGIMIGIASVLTTVGMGRGAQRSFSQEIEELGVNLLTISPNWLSSNQKPLTSGDVAALADPRLHPELAQVIPEQSGFTNLAFEDKGFDSQVIGTTSAYSSARNLKFASGRFFTEQEVDNYTRVVIIDASIAEELFGARGAIGQEVRIRGMLFQVIGVLEASEEGGFGISFGATAYVPLTVAQGLLFQTQRVGGETTVSEISVQVREQSLLTEAEYRIERTLRLRHNLEADDENDFMIINQGRLLGFVGDFTAVLTVFLGSIGAVSLFVGGIGIMNIMLVSVTERTREIGLRKALGAQDGDILTQFLIEALVLCAIGGAMGIGLSFGIGALLNLIPNFPLKVYIELGALLIALSVSVACGLIFGLYPAIRATRLDPIEALRYE
ncbi:MAG: ABC transporter permease [Chloroflexota bacterium]